MNLEMNSGSRQRSRGGRLEQVDLVNQEARLWSVGKTVRIWEQKETGVTWSTRKTTTLE